MAKNKEKVRYVDDGRTLADMSSVSTPLRGKASASPRPDFKDVWKTYWSAVRMMIKPMLIVLIILAIVYVVAYLLLTMMA